MSWRPDTIEWSSKLIDLIDDATLKPMNIAYQPYRTGVLEAVKVHGDEALIAEVEAKLPAVTPYSFYEELCPIIDPKVISAVVKKIREYFDGIGYLEVFTNNRPSVMSSCEDARTVATFQYAGRQFALPQTQQPALEHVFYADDGTVEGYYTLSTSYRDEQHPVRGRHQIAFPLFEWEGKGDVNRLMDVEEGLLRHLGFTDVVRMSYTEVCEKYGVEEVTLVEEEKLGHEHQVVLMYNFPVEHTYFNMKRIGGGLAAKVDAIVGGKETFGSAERSSNVGEMQHSFETSEGGEYAKKLREIHGDGLEYELNAYFDLFKNAKEERVRNGAGIGMTRLIAALQKHDLL